MAAFMSNYSGITEAIEGIIKSGSESCTLHEKKEITNCNLNSMFMVSSDGRALHY